jgi:ribonuclease BN (tRNA processing enzyme)
MREDAMGGFMIRGPRGTAPVCHPAFSRYGGNTTCFSAWTPAGLLLIDAGTGLSHVNRELAKLVPLPPITILFTHFHLDHLFGLPGFDPLYDPNAFLTIVADPGRDADWRTTLATYLGKPFWPVHLGQSGASTNLEDLPVRAGRAAYAGVEVTWCRVPHPQGCVAYRLRLAGRDIVVATDVECRPNDVDAGFAAFCRNADHLVFDAQFTPDEYPRHREWGHSTWEAAARVAQQARVGHLVLTHHDPHRPDSEMDRIVDAARAVFPNTDAACENMPLA